MISTRPQPPAIIISPSYSIAVTQITTGRYPRSGQDTMYLVSNY